MHQRTMGQQRIEIIEQLAHIFAVSPDTIFREMMEFREAVLTGRSPRYGAYPPSEKTIRQMRSRGVSLRNRVTREFMTAFISEIVHKSKGLSRHELEELLELLKVSGLDVAALSLPRAATASSTPKSELIENLSLAEDESGVAQSIADEVSGFYFIVRSSMDEGKRRFVKEPIYLGGPNEESWLLSRNVGLFKGFCFHQRRVSTCILHRRSTYEGASIITMMISFGENLRKEMFPGIILHSSQESRAPLSTKFIVTRADLSKQEREELTELPRMEDQVEIIELSRRTSEVLPDNDSLTRILRSDNFTLATELPSEPLWYEMMHGSR